MTAHLMLLTLLAVWLGGSGYLYLSYQTQTRQYAEHTLEEVAQRSNLLALMQAELVDSKLTHYDRLLQHLQPQVSRHLEADMDTATLSRLLRDQAISSGSLSDLFFVSPQGDIIARANEGSMPNVFELDSFQAHLDTAVNQRYLSRPAIVDEHGKSVVAITRPAFDMQGEWQGVLAVTLNLELFSHSLDAITLNESIFSAIFRNDGDLLLVTPYSSVLQHAMLPSLPGALEALVPGSHELDLESENRPLQVAHHPLPDWGLLVFVAEDLAQVHDTIEHYRQSQRQRLLSIAIVCTLLLLSMAGLLHQRLQSLRQLRAGEQELLDSHLHNQAIIHAMPDLLMTISADGTIIAYEAGQKDISLVPPEQFLGRRLSDVLPPQLASEAQESIGRALATGQLQTFEYSLNLSQHITGDYEARITRINDTQVLAIILDITERKEAQQALQWQATHDSLTGLPNRVLFYDRLQQSINEQIRRNDQTFALLYLDLDGFKAVNDTLGHAAGDELLCKVADRLQTRLRASDTVARLAGDEFGVIVKQCTRDDAENLIKSITSDLTITYQKGNNAVMISASIGIAVYPEDGATADALVSAADHAMYNIKHSQNKARTNGVMDGEI